MSKYLTKMLHNENRATLNPVFNFKREHRLGQTMQEINCTLDAKMQIRPAIIKSDP